MHRLLVVVAFTLFFPLCAGACDVGLFALIAGDNPDQIFGEKLTGLVASARAVNDNSHKPEALNETLQKLMSDWIEFSSAYMVNVPDWAKTNQNWQAYFNDLASLIGSLRRNLEQKAPDQVKAHHDILRFTRRLTRLYDGMPMSRTARLQLDISMHIDNIWSAWWAKEQSQLLTSTQTLASACQELNAELVASDSKAFSEVAHRAAELHKMAAKPNVIAEQSFEFLLNLAEYAYTHFNEIRQQNASPQEK